MTTPAKIAQAPEEMPIWGRRQLTTKGIPFDTVVGFTATPKTLTVTTTWDADTAEVKLRRADTNWKDA